MAESFAPHALSLAGLAPRLLGWTPDIFWNATPAELAAILAPEAGGGPPLMGRRELEDLMEAEAHG